MRVLIFGYGRQGKLVAKDMRKVVGDDNVYVADQLLCMGLNSDPKNSIRLLVHDHNNIVKVCKGFDLVIGCLPASCGFTVMMAIIESGVDYVDLSFLGEDVSSLNGEAMHRKVTVIPDAGVAPGLSNLIVGRAMHTRSPKSVEIHVGGIAEDEDIDYIVTWSPSDLIEEYTRPARIIRNGKIEVLSALSEEQRLTFTNVGEVSSYVTDGLRSLLSYEGEIGSMVEKTIRWPKHVDNFISPYINMSSDLRAAQIETVSVLKYGEYNGKERNIKDILLMAINVDDESVMLSVGATDETAMSRATAHSCSAFASLLVSGIFPHKGVFEPEKIAKHDDAYKFILDRLAENGIRFDTKYPFL